MAYSPSEMIWGSEGHHLSLAERKQAGLLTGVGTALEDTQLGISNNLLLLFKSLCAGTQEEQRASEPFQLELQVV